MCKKDFLYYTDNETIYSDAGNLTFDDHCNGWVIKNTGTTLLVIDNKEILQPTESKSFGGNVGELYRGRHAIKFQIQAIPPASIINQATLTEKIYIQLGY